jgi:hypothetical protein
MEQLIPPCTSPVEADVEPSLHVKCNNQAVRSGPFVFVFVSLLYLIILALYIELRCDLYAYWRSWSYQYRRWRRGFYLSCSSAIEEYSDYIHHVKRIRAAAQRKWTKLIGPDLFVRVFDRRGSKGTEFMDAPPQTRNLRQLRKTSGYKVGC